MTTTQLAPRQPAEPDGEHGSDVPEVLFEEARRRRRRRWLAGGSILAAGILIGGLTLGNAGGGGGRSSGEVRQHPSGSGPGAGSGHATESRLFPGAPATQSYYTGPGASCQLAPRNRYLPAWSGCVSTMVADVSGTGRPDLVLTYSSVRHTGVSRKETGGRYPAVQAMLRVVSPDGRVITEPIRYMTSLFNRTPARLQSAESTALISIAHVSDQPGEEIFLKTQQISSGSLALAYGLYRGRLVSAGVLLGIGGDSGTQAGFQCLPGNPPVLLQHYYSPISRITFFKGELDGRWAETTTTYEWHGPLLLKVRQVTVKRRMRPSDTAGIGCRRGIT